VDLIDEYAPGLRTLPDVIAGLRDPWRLLDAGSVDAYVALLFLVGIAYLVVCLSIRRVRLALFPDRTALLATRATDDVPRATNTSLLRRLWWKLRPPHDLMRVDGLTIDRSRKPHCAWLGPTGAGKSASVATVRVNGQRPMLIVTPDLSDPLRDATLRLGGVLWTACVSRRPVNFLLGTPTEVAERLTEVFRSGGVGAWKRAARRATADVIRSLDIQGAPRSLQAIGEGLQDAVKADRELKVVCAGWVSRFLDLADQFGSSIGSDGADIADLLNAGMTVLLDNDSFDHPSLGGDVVALGLAEAKRCASLVPQGFRLIFEEAGQLGERIDLADPFFRAGRRRKITVDALTQAESDLDEGISANTATRVYFAQELKSLQKVAADRLGLDYRKLDPANMRDFTAYVAHGKIRRLIRFPKPPTRALPRRDSLLVENGTERTGQTKPRYVIQEIGTARRAQPALPAPKGLHAVLAARVYRDGECERWKGDHNDQGYGRVRMPDGSRMYVHRLRWELAYGPIGFDEAGNRLTIDHQRTCHKDCSRLEHLELVTRSENSKRRWRVRGVAAAD
jgi:HNH endonuclease